MIERWKSIVETAASTRQPAAVPCANRTNSIGSRTGSRRLTIITRPMPHSRWTIGQQPGGRRSIAARSARRARRRTRGRAGPRPTGGCAGTRRARGRRRRGARALSCCAVSSGTRTAGAFGFDESWSRRSREPLPERGHPLLRRQVLLGDRDGAERVDALDAAAGASRPVGRVEPGGDAGRPRTAARRDPRRRRRARGSSCSGAIDGVEVGEPADQPGRGPRSRASAVRAEVTSHSPASVTIVAARRPRSSKGRPLGLARPGRRRALGGRAVGHPHGYSAPRTARRVASCTSSRRDCACRIADARLAEADRLADRSRSPACSRRRLLQARPLLVESLHRGRLAPHAVGPVAVAVGELHEFAVAGPVAALLCGLRAARDRLVEVVEAVDVRAGQAEVRVGPARRRGARPPRTVRPRRAAAAWPAASSASAPRRDALQVALAVAQARGGRAVARVDVEQVGQPGGRLAPLGLANRRLVLPEVGDDAVGLRAQPLLQRRRARPTTPMPSRLRCDSSR